MWKRPFRITGWTRRTSRMVSLHWVCLQKLEAGGIGISQRAGPVRYNIDSGPLDSQSVHLTYNPSANWSTQVSYGHIKSPEALEPDVNVNRTTASVTANIPYDANNWQTTLAWGRNAPSSGKASNAYLLESALSVGKTHTFFGRGEVVDKDELFENTPASPLSRTKFQDRKSERRICTNMPSQRTLQTRYRRARQQIFDSIGTGADLRKQSCVIHVVCSMKIQ